MTFRRDWRVHPGELLQEALDERKMSQSYLAFATGYSQKHINQIVKGHVGITPTVAVRLERELGSRGYISGLCGDHRDENL